MLQPRTWLRSFALRSLVHARHSSQPYTAFHTFTSKREDHTPPPSTSSDGDTTIVTSTKQEDLPIPQLSSNDPSNIVKIYRSTGQEELSIRPSRPNSKYHEELLTRLSKLLSTHHPNSRSALGPYRKNLNWSLGKDGDSILKFFFLSDIALLDKFLTEIEEIPKRILHHPHHAYYIADQGRTCLVGLLCTTHRPPGLSLRDVKAAEEVDHALFKLAQKRRSTIFPANAGRKLILERLEWSLDAQARIGKRDGEEYRIRSNGEHLDTEYLDKKFRVTEDLRNELKLFTEDMQREHKAAVAKAPVGDVAGGNHAGFTADATDQVPAHRGRGENRDRLPNAPAPAPSSEGTSSETSGSTSPSKRAQRGPYTIKRLDLENEGSAKLLPSISRAAIRTSDSPEQTSNRESES